MDGSECKPVTIILTLMFIVHSTFVAQAGANEGHVPTTISIPTYVPKNPGCSIKGCQKFFKQGDMVAKFNTTNLKNNYIDAIMTAECNNKTVEICTVLFWKSDNNKMCKLLVNPATSDASITVKNGTKYKLCKVMLKFYRTGHCIRHNSDHHEMVEAIDGDEDTTEHSSSSTDSSHTKIKAKGEAFKRGTTPSTTRESIDETTKDQSCPSGATKNTLHTSLIIMAACFLIFGYSFH